MHSVGVPFWVLFLILRPYPGVLFPKKPLTELPTILAFGAQASWTWLTILQVPFAPLLSNRYQPLPHTTGSLLGMAFIVSSVLRIPQTAL